MCCIEPRGTGIESDALRVLPSGTITFLLSNVEGSTGLLERYGSAMGAALARQLPSPHRP